MGGKSGNVFYSIRKIFHDDNDKVKALAERNKISHEMGQLYYLKQFEFAPNYQPLRLDGW